MDHAKHLVALCPLLQVTPLQEHIVVNAASKLARQMPCVHTLTTAVMKRRPMVCAGLTDIGKNCFQHMHCVDLLA